jgi:hypothetical protein
MSFFARSIGMKVTLDYVENKKQDFQGCVSIKILWQYWTSIFNPAD